VTGHKNLIAFVCGGGLVVAGFIMLARGSLTLAPFLLVIGYCVAIPLGIFMGAGKEGRSSERAQG
jgi:hypothetical protein